MAKPHYAQNRQKLMASPWVDKGHRKKWEFIEKRLGREMTPDELKDYIGYLNRRGEFKAPAKDWYAVPPGTEVSEENGDDMPACEREIVLQLRTDAKMGRKLDALEQAYCEKMYCLFPTTYPKDAEVHEITKKLVIP